MAHGPCCQLMSMQKPLPAHSANTHALAPPSPAAAPSGWLARAWTQLSLPSGRPRTTAARRRTSPPTSPGSRSARRRTWRRCEEVQSASAIRCCGLSLHVVRSMSGDFASNLSQRPSPLSCPRAPGRFDRRTSPEYDGEGGRRRSRSPGSRRPQTEYITSFGSSEQAPGHGQGPRQQQRQDEGSTVRDAVPGAADPALEGPHMLPAEAIKLHGVRPEERGRDRYSSVSGRVRQVWGQAGCWDGAVEEWPAVVVTNSLGRRWLGNEEGRRPALPHALCSLENPWFAHGFLSTLPMPIPFPQDYSKAKAAAAAPRVVKAVDKSKETPQARCTFWTATHALTVFCHDKVLVHSEQWGNVGSCNRHCAPASCPPLQERLKRLMAAQLNKKIQSDTITAAQARQAGPAGIPWSMESTGCAGMQQLCLARCRDHRPWLAAELHHHLLAHLFNCRRSSRRILSGGRAWPTRRLHKRRSDETAIASVLGGAAAAAAPAATAGGGAATAAAAGSGIATAGGAAGHVRAAGIGSTAGTGWLACWSEPRGQGVCAPVGPERHRG